MVKWFWLIVCSTTHSRVHLLMLCSFLKDFVISAIIAKYASNCSFNWLRDLTYVRCFMKMNTNTTEYTVDDTQQYMSVVFVPIENLPYDFDNIVIVLVCSPRNVNNFLAPALFDIFFFSRKFFYKYLNQNSFDF